jgi:hypothetical protein
MKIELSEKDAKNLVRMIGSSEAIAGFMNDYIDDPGVATRARVWKQLQQTVFAQLREQGLTDMIDYEYENFHLSEREFESIMSVQDKYEDLIAYKDISNKLAWRDFHEAHTPEQIEKMQADGKTYFGVELHPFEERYWNEFDEHGFDRLYVREDD